MKDVKHKDLAKVLKKVEDKKEYIDIEELGNYMQSYNSLSDKFYENYKVSFDIISFQKLSILFHEAEIFESLFKRDGIDKDIKVSKENSSKICEVFGYKNDKKLFDFIINMWVGGLSIIDMIQYNLKNVKIVNGSPTLVPKESLKKDKSRHQLHLYAPKINLYELRVRINLIIQTLLSNGESRDTIKEINIMFSVYMFAKLREIGL